MPETEKEISTPEAATKDTSEANQPVPEASNEEFLPATQSLHEDNGPEPAGGRSEDQPPVDGQTSAYADPEEIIRDCIIFTHCVALFYFILSSVRNAVCGD